MLNAVREVYRAVRERGRVQILEDECRGAATTIWHLEGEKARLGSELKYAEARIQRFSDRAVKAEDALAMSRASNAKMLTKLAFERDRRLKVEKDYKRSLESISQIFQSLQQKVVKKSTLGKWPCGTPLTQPPGDVVLDVYAGTSTWGAFGDYQLKADGSASVRHPCVDPSPMVYASIRDQSTAGMPIMSDGENPKAAMGGEMVDELRRYMKIRNDLSVPLTPKA